MTAGSYIIRGGVEGRERLRVMSRAVRGDTTALLRRLGLPPVMRYLHAGCGRGNLTLDLACPLLPADHLMGVDLDETKLDLARVEADRCGFDNVTYQYADVTNGSLPTAFDFAYARFVLTTLPRPETPPPSPVDPLLPAGISPGEGIDGRGP